MSKLDPVTQELAASKPLLWTVRTYLDLISGSDQLVWGDGLKSLYVMSTGLASFNDDEIAAITTKADRQGLLPYSLRGFMIKRIVSNCELYGRLLGEKIRDRLIDIASGDVPKPSTRVSGNPVAARWGYYLPPQTLVSRIRKALNQGGFSYGDNQPGVTLFDACVDAELALANASGREGHMVPQPASYVALAAVVERLTCLLHAESQYPVDALDYRKNARPALTILWVLAKFLFGDLTVRPAANEISRVDLEGDLQISDGTLAALPFPTRQSMTLFRDEGYGRGMTLKARSYLNAVSTASLCRTAL